MKPLPDTIQGQRDELATHGYVEVAEHHRLKPGARAAAQQLRTAATEGRTTCWDPDCHCGTNPGNLLAESDRLEVAAMNPDAYRHVNLHFARVINGTEVDQ